MKVNRYLRSYPGLLPFLLVMIILMGINVIIIVGYHRDNLISAQKNYVQQEIELMAEMVREATLKHDLSTVEAFLLQWYNRNTNINTIQVIAENGFLLFNYSRNSHSEKTVSYSKSVDYQGKKLMTIKLEHDMNFVEQNVEDLGTSLGLLSVLMVFIMGLITWYVIRRTAVIPMQKEIARRKELEDKLRNQKNHLAEIIWGTNAGTWEWNIKTGETRFNETWAQIVGYTLEELMPTNIDSWLQLCHPEDVKKSGELLEKHFSGELDYYQCEARMRHKNGDWIWVLDRGKVVEWTKDGKPLRMSGTHSNITNMKEAELKLRHATELAENASRTKSEFLAQMSHEIRTPMAGILGMADLVIDTELTPQQLDWLTSIKTSGHSLLRILNEILDQSKLEAGKLDISPVDFHLHSFIDQTCNLFTPKIEEKGLEINLVIDKDTPKTVCADQLRIGQVLSNLMSNALKFTDKGNITVNVKHEQLDDGNIKLYFKVSDTGIGLSKKAQRNIFSTFSQADSSISRKYGGTGLGLSISHQLVELMSGEIGVDSIKGKGSSFWFTVLCNPATTKVEAIERRKAVTRWKAIQSLKFLVAEDNIVNQKIISTILGKLGHIVTIANNGAEALEFFQNDDFNIILMDIRMPIMDGIVTTRNIRAINSEKAKIPIIALTADITAENIKQYIDAGMNDVCEKPLDLPVILKSINKQLGKEVHLIDPEK